MIDPHGSETRQAGAGRGGMTARASLAAETEAGLLARLRRRPRAAGLQRRLAAVRILEGRWQMALEGLEAAQSLCPEAADLRFLSAYARVEGLGRPLGAYGAKLRSLAVSLRPARFRAYLQAWTLLRTGRAPEAIGRLEPPQSAGDLQIWPAVALHHFRMAVGNPDLRWRPPDRLGRFHPLLGERLGRIFAGGNPFWNPLLAVGADSLARHACSRQLWLLARSAWEEAFLLDPRPARLELRLALIPADGSEEERRLVHLALAVQSSPESGGAHFALGVEYARQGFLRRASREMAIAWEIGMARGWLAGVGSPRALQRPWVGEAAAAFGRAVDGRKPASFLRDGYVRALLGIGRFEEALRQLEIVEKVEANRADFYLRRGGALLGLGRLREGVSSLDQAVSLGGSRRVAREVLEVFGRVGAWTAATRPAEES